MLFSYLFSLCFCKTSEYNQGEKEILEKGKVNKASSLVV